MFLLKTFFTFLPPEQKPNKQKAQFEGSRAQEKKFNPNATFYLMWKTEAALFMLSKPQAKTGIQFFWIPTGDAEISCEREGSGYISPQAPSNAEYVWRQ